MGSRGRKSGRGSSGAQGPHHVTVTKKEIEARIAKEMKRVPSSLRDTLAKNKVTVHVVTVDEARRIHPKLNESTRGFYSYDKKQAYVIQDRFQHRRGAKDAAMTALHEQGHGLDVLKGKGGRISYGKEFVAAVQKDAKALKSKNLSQNELSNVTYQHYPDKKSRLRELAAEGFAVLHGSGRPANSSEAVKTSSFKKAWPNALKVLKDALMQ